MVAPVRSNLVDLDALTTHLARLDHGAALAVVERARSEGASVEGIVTGLLAPALVEVGRRWAAGEVGAAEALAAAAIARAAIPRAPIPPNPPGGRSVAVCCPPGEHHEIPAEMVTELLRAEGCPAQHLGAGVTPKHLPNFLSRQHPSALLISCTSPCGLPGAARSIEVAHAYGVPVIVGGAAFGRDALLALRLGAAAWAPSARHAVGIVESWMSRPVPLPTGRALSEEYLMYEAGLPEIRAGVVTSLRRIAGDSDGDDPGGVADTQDRLELLLRHLGAALLVDDGRLFLDFLSWRAEYYTHRNIGSERLTNALTAVSAALPSEFSRARRFVEEGRQHVAWLVRSGGAAEIDWGGARFSPADNLPARPAGVPGPPPVLAPGVQAAVASATQPALVAARPSPGQDQRGRVFADLLFVAATTCHAPFALISVAQGDGRWSTLAHGVDRRDLLADDRLFSAVGRSVEPVQIADLTKDADLGGGPLARGPLGVRFVYGMPLRNRQSVLLGVLCVMDRRARELSARERQALSAVARQVAGQLAMWRRDSSSMSTSSTSVSSGSTLAGSLSSGPPSPGSLSSGPGFAGSTLIGATSPGSTLAPAASSGSTPYGSAPSVASPLSAVPATVPLAGAGGVAGLTGFGGLADAARRGDGAASLQPVLDRPSLHVHRDGGDELLRSHEVAVLFDVTDRTVINWAAAKKLPSIRTAGGHLRFRGDDVLALLAGRPVSDRSA